MDADWNNKLLRAARRADAAQVEEFLRLVDQADENCSLDTVRILMRTFTANPDYGTQERVGSVLATARPEDVTRGILEELPRLMSEAPEWAVCLVGVEIDYRPALLSAVAATMPDEIRDCLRQLTQSESFVDFYPAAKTLRFP